MLLPSFLPTLHSMPSMFTFTQNHKIIFQNLTIPNNSEKIEDHQEYLHYKCCVQQHFPQDPFSYSGLLSFFKRREGLRNTAVSPQLVTGECSFYLNARIFCMFAFESIRDLWVAHFVSEPLKYRMWIPCNIPDQYNDYRRFFSNSRTLTWPFSIWLAAFFAMWYLFVVFNLFISLKDLLLKSKNVLLFLFIFLWW